MARCRPFALLVLALGLASPGVVAPAGAEPPAGPTAQRTPLSMGWVAFASVGWPFWAARSIGTFEQQGLELDVSVLGSAPLVGAALVSGSLDIGVTAMDVHIRLVERGGNAVWFMTQFAPPIYSLLARPPIDSYAGLGGRTIIVDQPNGSTMFFTRRMIAQAGLGPEDVNFAYAGSTPDRMAALTAGGVDAAILIQPFDFAAERQGYRRLGNSNEVVSAYEFSGMVARADWLRPNESTIARFLRGYLAGQRCLYDPANKDQAIQVLVEVTRQSTEDARATYELYVERERSFPVGGRINLAGVQAVLDALVDLGGLTTPTPPPSKYVDPSYVDRYGQ